mmetsp:Transcript_38150/g.82995  ORF Transcript_38150/g.82995 Transcript_38150/m.82995 type:complete len:268 (+) Transcript_38150:337-1140(+)
MAEALATAGSTGPIFTMSRLLRVEPLPFDLNRKSSYVPRNAPAETASTAARTLRGSMSGHPSTVTAAVWALCALPREAAALPSAFQVLGAWVSAALPMPTMPTRLINPPKRAQMGLPGLPLKSPSAMSSVMIPPSDSSSSMISSDARVVVASSPSPSTFSISSKIPMIRRSPLQASASPSNSPIWSDIIASFPGHSFAVVPPRGVKAIVVISRPRAPGPENTLATAAGNALPENCERCTVLIAGRVPTLRTLVAAAWRARRHIGERV